MLAYSLKGLRTAWGSTKTQQPCNCCMMRKLCLVMSKSADQEILSQASEISESRIQQLLPSLPIGQLAGLWRSSCRWKMCWFHDKMLIPQCPGFEDFEDWSRMAAWQPNFLVNLRPPGSSLLLHPIVPSKIFQITAVRRNANEIGTVQCIDQAPPWAVSQFDPQKRLSMRLLSPERDWDPTSACDLKSPCHTMLAMGKTRSISLQDVSVYVSLMHHEKMEKYGTRTRPFWISCAFWNYFGCFLGMLYAFSLSVPYQGGTVPHSRRRRRHRPRVHAITTMTKCRVKKALFGTRMFLCTAKQRRISVRISVCRECVSFAGFDFDLGPRIWLW